MQTHTLGFVLLGFLFFGLVDYSCLFPQCSWCEEQLDGREGGREIEKSNDATWRFPFCLEATVQPMMERRGGGEEGGGVITPWDSLFPPPTFLILFFNLSFSSVCLLFLSPFFYSPPLSSHIPSFFPHPSSLTPPAHSLSLWIRGSCLSVFECLREMCVWIAAIIFFFTCQ